MPRASRKLINKDLNDELNENFLILISSLRVSQEINYFFAGFLTKEEKKMIPKRLMLHLMLINNIPDSKISAHLGMSYETIRTHKNSLDSLSNEYKEILAKISRRESIRNLFKKIDKKMERLDSFLKAKSNMKARAKVYGE